MLNFGWAELLIVMAVAVFVIGPQDIPKIMYGLGRVMRRFQYIRYAFSQQMDDILRAGDIKELQRGVNIGAEQTDEKAADDDMTKNEDIVTKAGDDNARQ